MNNRKEIKLLFVSGAYIGDVEKNIAKAEEVSIGLIRAGFHVVTPHKNIAGYEKYEDGTLNKRTWMDMCFNILRRCDAVYVMDNWKSSEGAKEEIMYAQRHKIPVIYEEEFSINMVQEFWRIARIFDGDGRKMIDETDISRCILYGIISMIILWVLIFLLYIICGGKY